MTKVKKGSGGGGVPSLDILAARVKVVEAELSLEEKEITLQNGRPFVAEPNLNLRLRVVKNLVEPGGDEGVEFFDRFKLKQDSEGEWFFAKYSKLGNLVALRYGEEWFEDEAAEFEASDFEGFEFVGQIEPKTDPKGNPLTGSVLNWRSMRPTGCADEAEAKEADEAEAVEDDFDSIPF
jgi:hypothetical protein